MAEAMMYDGWVSRGWTAERPAATGSSFGFIKLVGWVAAAGAALANVGTGGERSLEQLQRTNFQAHIIAGLISQDHASTASEDLRRIRAVFPVAVSDLANTFGVTRQSVYNWLNGESIAEDNAAKLRDLAQAADLLSHEGVAMTSALLKRRIVNGKTLLQVSQAGESARDAALLLVQIHKQEVAQRQRMNARFAKRARTHATADFDLPASNDRA